MAYEEMVVRGGRRGDAGAVAVPRIIRYRNANLEKLQLNAAVREKLPGSFVQLPDGVMHYELAGPADGRLVVLIAGFSAPYTVWDPTFAALTQAGFRVLRYDHFGRGYSTGRMRGTIPSSSTSSFRIFWTHCR